MRVLIICPFFKPDIGGVESHLDKLTNYLAEKKGVRVTVLTYMPLNSTTRPPSRELKGNLEILRVRWFGKGWFRRFEPYFLLNFFYLFPGLFYKSWRLYRSEHHHFDVIHAHGFIAGAIARILTKLHPKWTVLSTHAIYALRPGSIKGVLFKFLLKGFDQVLAVGDPSLNEIVGLGIPREIVKIHPNWVDVESFHPSPMDEARRRLGLPERGFIILFAGRMIGIKGEMLLLECARRSTDDRLFVFVGDGPNADEIRREAQTNARVIFLGKLKDDEMKDAYRSADLFASPVLYDEGFATVYLESLSCGTPVLTGRRGCLPGFLNSAVADLLNPVSLEAVSEKISEHSSNRNALNARRAVCRDYALSNFSVRNADVIYNSYLS